MHMSRKSDGTGPTLEIEKLEIEKLRSSTDSTSASVALAVKSVDVSPSTFVGVRPTFS
jgi:hypothetical protein